MPVLHQLRHAGRPVSRADVRVPIGGAARGEVRDGRSTGDRTESVTQMDADLPLWWGQAMP
jgi:hypothetical protein